MNVTFGCVLGAKRSAKSGRISRVILLGAIHTAIVASALPQVVSFGLLPSLI